MATALACPSPGYYASDVTVSKAAADCATQYLGDFVVKLGPGEVTKSERVTRGCGPLVMVMEG